MSAKNKDLKSQKNPKKKTMKKFKKKVLDFKFKYLNVKKYLKLLNYLFYILNFYKIAIFTIFKILYFPRI